MPTARAFPWDEPCAFSPRRKDRFHAAAKSALRRLADELGLEPGGYDIRTDRGDAAASGESVLRHELFRVSVSQPPAGKPGIRIVPADGGRATAAPLRALDDPRALADVVRDAQPEVENRRGLAPR